MRDQLNKQKLARIQLRKDKSILKEPYVYAADYNLDGKVTLSDIMKINPFGVTLAE